MLQGNVASLPMNNSHALLFTDARGHVVFVDNNFLRLMSRAKSGGIVGSPLHSVMGIPPETATQILRDTSQHGSLKDRMLDLRADTGAVVRVACSSVATYDDRNSFIGADVMLTEVARAGKPETAAPAAEVVGKDERIADEGAFLTIYFITALQALRDLLAHVGGDRPRQSLEAIVNETANRSEWPVLIQAGKVYAEVHSNEGEIFRGLLARAIAYATGVIGEKMVLSALAQVDGQTDATTLDLADRYGLRDLIHSQ